MLSFHFRRIKFKLIFYIGATTFASLFILSLIFFFYRSHTTADFEFNKLKTIRDYKIFEINSWLDKIVGDIRNISNSDAFRNACYRICAADGASPVDKVELRNYLNNYLNNFNYYNEFFIVNPMNGRIVFSTNIDVEGEDRSGNPYVTETLKRGGLFIKDIYFSKNLNIPTMTFSVPLYNVVYDEKSVSGILVARIYLERSVYNLLLERTGLGKTGEAYIVNSELAVLNKLRGYDGPPLSFKMKDEASFFSLKGRPGSIECVDYRGESVFAVYATIPRLNWGFVVKQDSDEILWSSRIMLVWMAGFIITIMTVVGAIAFNLSNNFSYPLASMIAVSTRIRNGDYSARNEIRRDDDFGYLANSFDAMANSIVKQLTIQKNSSDIIEVLVTAIDLNEFSNTVLMKLVEATESNLGAFYLLSDNGREFKHLTSIGLDIEAMESFHAGKLEGEFGKALVTQKITVTRNITERAMIKLRTVIGDLLPSEIITIPVIVNNKSVAIVSLASLNEYSANIIDILNHVRPVMNTAFSNIIALEETRRLAKELSDKNHLLESQKEALEMQADELQKQSKKVGKQNIELEHQRLRVEEANRLKSEFLSNMSHELRTPLNSILSLSRILMRQSRGKLAQEELDYLAVIDRNGEKLLTLINDILDLSKIEAGRIDLKPKKLSLVSLITMIVENLEQVAENKGIDIKMEYSNEVPQIESDEPRVYQILQNIIGNAVKFTEEGGVNIRIGLGGALVVVVIEDTGIGIAEADLPHIFEEFRQIDGTLARKYDGTGLGLAIAQKSAQLIGARIDVSSVVGRGSVFTVTVPVKWPEDLLQSGMVDGENNGDNGLSHNDPYQDSGAGETRRYLVRGRQKTAVDLMKILVVDDDPDNLISINAVLRDRFHVIEARDGMKALEKALNESPDLMLLDMALPGISGFDVVRELKAIRSTRNIPVIALTALSMKGDRERTLEAGCDDYISKPYNIDNLLQTIDKWLRYGSH